jgi:hypothetical protein
MRNISTQASDTHHNYFVILAKLCLYFLQKQVILGHACNKITKGILYNVL